MVRLCGKNSPETNLSLHCMWEKPSREKKLTTTYYCEWVARIARIRCARCTGIIIHQEPNWRLNGEAGATTIRPQWAMITLIYIVSIVLYDVCVSTQRQKTARPNGKLWLSQSKPFLFCGARNPSVYVEPRTETIEKTTFLLFLGHSFVFQDIFKQFFFFIIIWILISAVFDQNEIILLWSSGTVWIYSRTVLLDHFSITYIFYLKNKRIKSVLFK